MTALAEKSMSAEDFVVWAAKRPEKHWELLDGVPQRQQAQTWGHARLIRRIARLLEDSIPASGLNVLVGTQGLAVKTGPGSAFEPDVVVFKGPMDDHEIIVREPVIAIEVLSPSTERRDLTVKLAGYFNVPSIEHYVIADWEARELIHYRWEGKGIAPPVILREGVLNLDPPGIALALAEVFN